MQTLTSDNLEKLLQDGRIVLHPHGWGIPMQTGLNMPAAFDLNADIPTATATIPAGLINSIQFPDALSGAVISSKRIELGKTETRNIIIKRRGATADQTKEYGLELWQ